MRDLRIIILEGQLGHVPSTKQNADTVKRKARLKRIALLAAHLREAVPGIDEPYCEGADAAYWARQIVDTRICAEALA